MSILPIVLSEEVESALKNNRPILALESTVISHGLPYPMSIEVLSQLEGVARKQGVVPATICLLDGKCIIGMQEADKERFVSKMQKEGLSKIALRDIPMAVSQKKSGGTTVSATMLLAHKAGIEVFATGGIGGVHRDWQDSKDISMDIKALEDIPVIVVCAGAKAILDIPATLETLESRAIPVYGWQTDEFPSFYSRESGLKIEKVDELDCIAHSFRLSKAEMDLTRGMLVANPIPKKSEIPLKRVQLLIDDALGKAKSISGKELTPFLLDALAKISEGETVRANIALLRNNVFLGSQLAKKLSQMS